MSRLIETDIMVDVLEKYLRKIFLNFGNSKMETTTFKSGAIYIQNLSYGILEKSSFGIISVPFFFLYTVLKNYTGLKQKYYT